MQHQYTNPAVPARQMRIVDSPEGICATELTIAPSMSLASITFVSNMESICATELTRLHIFNYLSNVGPKKVDDCIHMIPVLAIVDVIVKVFLRIVQSIDIPEEVPCVVCVGFPPE